MTSKQLPSEDERQIHVTSARHRYIPTDRPTDRGRSRATRRHARLSPRRSHASIMSRAFYWYIPTGLYRLCRNFRRRLTSITVSSARRGTGRNRSSPTLARFHHAARNRPVYYNIYSVRMYCCAVGRVEYFANYRPRSDPGDAISLPCVRLCVRTNTFERNDL